MSYDYKACGQRLQQLRLMHQETQLSLCSELNISLSLLKKIEGGQKPLTLGMLITFAEHFSTSTDYILLGTHNSGVNLKSKIHHIIAQLQTIENEM